MKIAIIRKKYIFHGGSEGFSDSLVTNLAKRGHEIHIFAIDWQSDRQNANIHFHKVPALKFASFLRDLSFALSCLFILKRKKNHFDIIQSHDKTLYQDIYRAGDGCHIEWLRQRWKRTGTVGRLSIALNPYHWLILALERYIFRRHRFRRVIAISGLVKKNIVDNYHVPQDDIEVIYNGVDIERFHPRNRNRFRNEIRNMYGLSDKSFVVLFVGSGFERKGVNYLIEAVESIKEPVTVLIVGKGSEKKFNKISPDPSLSKRGISPLCKRGNKGDYQFKQNIIFCGPQREVHKYYAAADVFVFPSMYEPFGNVHLEALASGLPVITTRNSGASEIIEDGRQGFVVESPEDVKAIASRISTLFNDRDKLRMTAERARKLAGSFTFDIHLNKMTALYKSISVN